MEKYIVANEAFYDEDKQLWGCYIGLNDDEKTLLLTVWGRTEVASKEAAEKYLKDFLV